MNANPAGIAACSAMRGTPKASSPGADASSETNCQAASARIAVTDVATMAENSCAEDCHFGGSACTNVPTASSRPSRAATMPPSIPMTSVRCRTSSSTSAKRMLAPATPSTKSSASTSASSTSSRKWSRVLTGPRRAWPSASRPPRRTSAPARSCRAPAGTCARFPLATRVSACGDSVVTLSPSLSFIAWIVCSSSSRAARRISMPARSDVSRSHACVPGSSCFHARSVSTSAPVIGAQRRSSMYGA